ncbi:phenylalanine--tRNA ligase subunit beta, partial [Mycobacterium tuberculosis]|nr:phenylalanine--tRNA ligase subunit beta [Mycobacterium tuberculosis]
VETTDCPRYYAQLVSGLTGTTPSPDWMKQALNASGVKPRNLLVDVTNYVLLELGQPLHAFDADKLVGAIIVRHAQQGETLELLN